MTFTKETFLNVENGTFVDIISTHVPSDSLTKRQWGSEDFRPDKNFNNQVIKSGESLTKREEVKCLARTNFFTMKLYFEDGTSDTYRLNQKHASKRRSPLDFQVSENVHSLKAWLEEKTIYVSVENTKGQIENHLAEKLNKKSEEKIEEGKYDEALSLLGEALPLADQESTIEKIKNNIARGNSLRGEELMQEAEDLEEKGDVEGAQKLLEEAKLHFKEARKVKNTEKYANIEKAINLKIEGNQIFNEAVKIEKEAFGLFKREIDSGVSGDVKKAQNKYEEALAKYGEALKKFEEGYKVDNAKFGASLNITKVQIQEVNEAIGEVDRAIFNYNVGLMCDKDKDDEEEDEEQDTEDEKKIEK